MKSSSPPRKKLLKDFNIGVFPSDDTDFGYSSWMVRDYIHVVDLADGHIAALRKLFDANILDRYSVTVGKINCLNPLLNVNLSFHADFIEELLHGRLVEEQLPPAVLTGYYWQASIANIVHDDVYDIYGDISPRGLFGDSIKELPSHMILDVNRAIDNICCPICLQEFEVGDTARSLPYCRHTFHQKCVDKWLIARCSCPVCRRDVYI